MDLVKVRMQTMSVLPGQAPPFTSTFDCISKTLAKDGIRGVYRGVSAPIIAIAPIYAVCFWGYDMGQRLSRAFYGQASDAKLTIGQISFAGAISAIPTTALMTPTERIKCLLQVQANAPLAAGAKPQYSGMLDCGAQVLREGGVRSLYKGTVATLIRDVPGSVMWFGAYELVKRSIADAKGCDVSSLSPAYILFAGGCGGVSNWLVSIPPDVIKSRLQTAPEGTYKGFVDCGTKLVKAEGMGALFKGVGPAMIRAFPANAACFLGMEISRSLLAFMD